MTQPPRFVNPFRPGAGHMPPYLAGRRAEMEEFSRLLDQDVILENMILTGLRGVGKTVLLDTLKPMALRERWLWVGTDLSESTSISEERLALRLLADLAVVTSSMILSERQMVGLGFGAGSHREVNTLDFNALAQLFQQTPGLVSDKLKAVFQCVWQSMRSNRARGLIFAYDEAQNLSDHGAKEEYPLSLLLDLFQSIQKQEMPFMLVMAGLPTLFPKLVEARTFAERMFHVVFLDRLAEQDTRHAILRPLQGAKSPLRLSEDWISTMIRVSGGYPYFIQFICREVYDLSLIKLDARRRPDIPINDIIRKLDRDFFYGRWARATDRQRDLLTVIAQLEHGDGEFTVQDVVERSKKLLAKGFSASHVSQMFNALIKAGLVYKNRHGKYLFAVPLLGDFILRQLKE